MEHDSHPQNQHKTNQPNSQNIHKNKPKKSNNMNEQIKKEKYHQDFKFNLNTLQRLFFKKVNKMFLQDLQTYMRIYNRRKIVNDVFKDFFNDNANLINAAQFSHQILQDLTYKCPQPKVPRYLIFTFIKYLIQNKDKILNHLNVKGGDKLLDMIPIQFLVNIIELYNLKLTKKHSQSLFRQLAASKYFQDIPRFILLTGHNYDAQLVSVIQRLIDQKQYKKLRLIPNLKRLFKQNRTLIKLKDTMLRNTAFYQFRSEGWEYLEEIFLYHPHIIADILNRNFGSRPSKFQKDQKYLQGVVSICQRNPNVLQRLKPDTKKRILSKRQEMLKQNIPMPINFLQINQFEPSSNDYFNFQQFQVTSKHVTWVDDKVDNEKLKQIKNNLLKCERISIDTESTLVRTPVDFEQDVLSLIQVSTDQQVYLFDPYNAKHPFIKSFFKEYFGDKDKIVIGHTIEDDIQGVAKFFQLPKPICKVIDIKTQFEKYMNTKKQISLKAISKQVLGKQICKKYTMTNWDRRPLNLCQIHYASMDAYVILKIWDKLSLLIEQKQKDPQKFKKIEQQLKNITIEEQETKVEQVEELLQDQNQNQGNREQKERNQ